MSPPLIEVDKVGRTYTMGNLFSRQRVRAVDGVSFAMEADRPEIFTIIGESGSGKTTLARMILNMVPTSEGSIRFRGTDLGRIRSGRDRLAFMCLVQPIFQNPFEAFNPLKRVDRYLYMTARRIAGLSTVTRSRRGPTRRSGMSDCHWPRSAAASRTNSPAVSSSASPSPVRSSRRRR